MRLIGGKAKSETRLSSPVLVRPRWSVPTYDPNYDLITGTSSSHHFLDHNRDGALRCDRASEFSSPEIVSNRLAVWLPTIEAAGPTSAQSN